MRIYKLEGRGVRSVVLAIVIVGVGVFVVASALTLLIVLGAVATVIGAGVVLYRRLTGRAVPAMPPAYRRKGLDPSLEVFPDEVVVMPEENRPPAAPPPHRAGVNATTSGKR